MYSPKSNVPRVVILGGGFAGVYTAMYLESLLGKHNDFEIVLVNDENYFVFQPMLAEVVSGNIGILDTVSPIHRLLRKTHLFVRAVDSIDLDHKTVTLRPGFWPRQHVVPYDHLVLAMGMVTDFRNSPGIREHAFQFKNLADAVQLRNHLIHAVEEANIETDPELQRQLLTFVVAGGGFSGVEVAAETNDFVRRLVRNYRRIDSKLVRVVLVHSGDRILAKELGPSLSLYAQKILSKRGVELCANRRLKTATPYGATLDNGERILSRTVVSTAPALPHHLIAQLFANPASSAAILEIPPPTHPLPDVRGKIKTTSQLNVEGFDDIWALGDCAAIPNPTGDGYCPPTAQHAIREAKTLAHNIAARLRGKSLKPFTFTGLGKMGSLGHRSAVAELFDRFRISGFPAWAMWRTIYWWKLPGFDRKLKVALAWMLDLLIPPESVQLSVTPPHAVRQAHFEPGEDVFRQGDLGDFLYIIVQGEVDVVLEKEGHEQIVARLKQGEWFGEMALINDQPRGATIRCVTPLDVLVLGRRDFKALRGGLPELDRIFRELMDRRMKLPAPPA